MEKTIKDFLNEEYKDFSLYTIEQRAIPSVIDGFKPTARKIVACSISIWKNGTEKPLKVFQLVGQVASTMHYHHGNSSAESAVITLAQKFKNNLPLLDEVGQFGSIRSPDPGAARYIGTKLTKVFNLIYKDNDLVSYKYDEGDKIEPNYYLPIIPMVLINGSSGIAVGFSSNILNRNPSDITNACLNILNDKKFYKIKPFNNYFSGEYKNDPENNKRWIIRGKYTVENTSTIKIVELPPSMTYEKYEKVLDKLVENRHIASYTDNCKDNIDYTIKFNREKLASLTEDEIFNLLKLEESETEMFSTLDEYGKLKIFESAEDIIYYFVNFRLNFYIKRKNSLIDKLNHELKIIANKAKFIKTIIDNKLSINNRKKDDICNDIEKLSLDKIEGSWDYLLRLPIYSLTKELYDKLKDDFKFKIEELDKLKKKDPKSMYIEDLEELKRNLR